MQLSALQTPHGNFTLIGLDNPLVMAAKFGLDPAVPSNEGLIRDVTSSLLKTFSQEVSGVVLDYKVGLPVIHTKAQGAGTALRLEEIAVESDPLSLPHFNPEWGVEEITNNYGVVKLELMYHPAEPKAMEKKQIVAEIFDYCQYQHVAFMLVLRLYSPSGEVMSSEEWQETQFTAVQELQQSCDVLVLECPKNALAAATLTAELDIPWLMLTAEPTYAKVKESLRLALENGAQGFLATDVVWSEIYSCRRRDKGIDEERLHQFVLTIGRDRIIELVRIVGEKVSH
jgi:tagatose-1,6-bisphosphate aldolase